MHVFGLITRVGNSSRLNEWQNSRKAWCLFCGQTFMSCCVLFSRLLCKMTTRISTDDVGGCERYDNRLGKGSSLTLWQFRHGLKRLRKAYPGPKSGLSDKRYQLTCVGHPHCCTSPGLGVRESMKSKLWRALPFPTGKCAIRKSLREGLKTTNWRVASCPTKPHLLCCQTTTTSQMSLSSNCE